MSYPHYFFMQQDFTELIKLKKLNLLHEIYKNRGASDQEWEELEKAVRELSSPTLKDILESEEPTGPTTLIRDPNVCARCERAKLAEQRRKDRE